LRGGQPQRLDQRHRGHLQRGRPRGRPAAAPGARHRRADRPVGRRPGCLLLRAGRDPLTGDGMTEIDTVDKAATDPDRPQPYAELGLKDDEYARIREILGRRPTEAELAMYSVMWSEH